MGCLVAALLGKINLCFSFDDGEDGLGGFGASVEGLPGFVEGNRLDRKDDFAAREADEVEPALALHEFGERGHPMRKTLRIGSIHKKQSHVKARGMRLGNNHNGHQLARDAASA